MLDINGIEIRLGMTVKSIQPSTGVLPSSCPRTGKVINYKLSYENKEVLAIKYHKSYNGIESDSFVLLEGKINEIIQR